MDDRNRREMENRSRREFGDANGFAPRFGGENYPPRRDMGMDMNRGGRDIRDGRDMGHQPSQYVPPKPAPITRGEYSPSGPTYPSQPAQFSSPYQPQQPQFARPVQQQESFDYDYNNQQFTSQPQYEQPRKKKGFFSFGKKDEQVAQGGVYSNVIITYPRTISDVQSIIDSLRARQAIIVDMSKLNDKGCQRIMDYLSGAIYALGGAQQRIADNMFLFTPDGVSIQGPSDLKKRFD